MSDKQPIYGLSPLEKAFRAARVFDLVSEERKHRLPDILDLSSRIEPKIEHLLAWKHDLPRLADIGELPSRAADDYTEVLSRVVFAAFAIPPSMISGVDWAAAGNESWSGNSSTTGTEFGALSMDDINQAFAHLKDAGPVVKAVWFVDCPAERGKFEMLLSRWVFENRVEAQPALHGVPLYDWYLKSATQEEKEAMVKAGCWFIFMPGVWFEMSDGQHKRLTFE